MSRMALGVLGGGLAVAIALDFAFPAHGYFGIDGWIGFDAWFGFASAVTGVLAARAFGALLRRPEKTR